MILDQKKLNIYHHDETIHKPMARLKDGFKNILGIEINLIQQMNSRIGIMIEFMVL